MAVVWKSCSSWLLSRTLQYLVGHQIELAHEACPCHPTAFGFALAIPPQSALPLPSHRGWLTGSPWEPDPTRKTSASA
eukprot:57772-Chlamydomonas_euryale.AAC.6